MWNIFRTKSLRIRSPHLIVSANYSKLKRGQFNSQQWAGIWYLIAVLTSWFLWSQTASLKMSSGESRKGEISRLRPSAAACPSIWLLRDGAPATLRMALPFKVDVGLSSDFLSWCWDVPLEAPREIEQVVGSKLAFGFLNLRILTATVQPIYIWNRCYPAVLCVHYSQLSEIILLPSSPLYKGNGGTERINPLPRVLGVCVTELGFDVGAHSLLTYLSMQNELGKAVLSTPRKLLDRFPTHKNLIIGRDFWNHLGYSPSIPETEERYLTVQFFPYHFISWSSLNEEETFQSVGFRLKINW